MKLLVTGGGTSLNALAKHIQSLPGVVSESRIRPARAVEVTRFVADVGRMRALLDLEPPLDPLLELPALWKAVAPAAEQRSG